MIECCPWAYNICVDIFTFVSGMSYVLSTLCIACVLDFSFMNVKACFGSKDRNIIEIEKRCHTSQFLLEKRCYSIRRIQNFP